MNMLLLRVALVTLFTIMVSEYSNARTIWRTGAVLHSGRRILEVKFPSDIDMRDPDELWSAFLGEISVRPFETTSFFSQEDFQSKEAKDGWLELTPHVDPSRSGYLEVRLQDAGAIWVSKLLAKKLSNHGPFKKTGWFVDWRSLVGNSAVCLVDRKRVHLIAKPDKTGFIRNRNSEKDTSKVKQPKYHIHPKDQIKREVHVIVGGEALLTGAFEGNLEDDPDQIWKRAIEASLENRISFELREGKKKFNELFDRLDDNKFSLKKSTSGPAKLTILVAGVGVGHFSNLKVARASQHEKPAGNQLWLISSSDLEGVVSEWQIFRNLVMRLKSVQMR